MWSRFSFSAKPTFSVHGVRLFLEPTATTFLSARVPFGDAMAPSSCLVPQDGHLQVTWFGPDDGDATPEHLEIEYEGAAPLFCRAEWIPRTSSLSASRANQANGSADHVVHERFVERRRRLRHMPQSSRLKRFQEFFFELDFQTYPGNPEASPSVPEAVAQRRSRRVEDLTELLKARLYLKAQEERETKQLPPPTDLEGFIGLSKVLRGLLEQYFSNRDGELSLELAEEAFERFSSGELRVARRGEYCESQADSGLHFAFAEFAFVALEMGIDEDIWKPLLNVLVRSQEIFLHAYPATLTERTSPNLITKFDTTDGYVGPLSSDVLSSIRDRYAGLDVSELDRASRWLLAIARTQGNIDARTIATWPLGRQD